MRDLKDALRAQDAQPVASAKQRSLARADVPKSWASSAASPLSNSYVLLSAFAAVSSSLPTAPLCRVTSQLTAISPFRVGTCNKNNTTAAAKRSDWGASGKMWILKLRVQKFLKSLRRLVVAAQMAVPALTKQE
jgi:hypothetical protein